MIVSYNRLWKRFIDENMMKRDLRLKAGLTTNVIAKMEKNEHVSTEVKRADEIIKNTYRTLMTRGMKGCYIYCTDEGMKKYLVSRLETMRNEAGNNRQN